MKILKDTLLVNGKFSQKRLQTFSAFYIAVVYAFSPIIVHIIVHIFDMKELNFEVKEFVFLGFLGAGGFSLFRTQKTNENNNNNIEDGKRDIEQIG